MDDFKNPIDQFINELGGTVAVAKTLGVAPSVVSSWRKADRIPNWRIGPIIEMARRQDKLGSLPSGIAA